MAFNHVLVVSWTRLLIPALMLLALAPRINGLAINYCSSENTAGNFQSVYNQYMSNGACQTACQSSYVYAVIQGQYCWCSNYVPADTVSTYSCNQVCPGFGAEWCGNTDAGLYAYFQVNNKAPSGTIGGSSSSSTSSSTSASSPSVSNTPSKSGPSAFTHATSFGGSSSLTVIATVQSVRTSFKTVETISTVPVVVSEPVTSSDSDTSTTSASTTAQPTEVYTSITTEGQTKTILVTTTPTSDSTLSSNTPIPSNDSGSGVSTGKVVGAVIGAALGIGLLIGLAVWLWLRKRHRRNMEAASLDSSSVRGSSNNGVPSRQVSQMSSAGLLGKAPRIITSGIPFGNNPRSADANFDRRSVGTDQRLNPYAIYAHDESRHSNVSLQDNQDYSRQLRVANPDP